MGLISWIKETYYNYRLSNADSAYLNKSYAEAERIYQEIIDKQPEAAEHLAKMYCEIAKSHNDELTYLGKLKYLFFDTPYGKDNVSLYLNQLISHIEKSAEKYFQNKDYNKAYKYLKSIELSKSRDSDFAKKIRLYALYVNLTALEFDTSYSKTIDLIKAYCKNDIKKDIEDAIIGTVERLHRLNKLDRAYCASNCLAKNGNNKAINECVSIAFDIYNKGNNSEREVIDENVLLNYILENSQSDILSGLGRFARFSETYKNKFISVGISTISSETDANKSFSIFKNVWKIAQDVCLIKIYSSQTSKIANLVYEYFIDNIASLKSNVDYQNALFKELSLFDDYDYTLSVLEKFKKNGLDKKDLYLAKIKSVIGSVDNDKRLILINRVLMHYGDDLWTLNEKMSIGDEFYASKDYEKAFLIYNELIGLHAKAQPKLAQLYYEQSLSETDFTEKRNLLIKAFSFKNSHDSLFDLAEYKKLIPNLSASAIELVNVCFSQNNPEEAYTTACIFQPFTSKCFDSYVKELKGYHDVNYVLAKLVSLKNDGVDIERDYTDVISKITSSTEFDDKNKLDVLSKSLNLFGNNNVIKEKFIQTSIVIIKKEKSADKVVEAFGKVWNQLADVRFFVEFVNQEYEFYTSIVDFLVNKSSIIRWNESLITEFCAQILKFDDYKYVLAVFDSLARKGIDVKYYYVHCVFNALPLLNIEERLNLVNETLAKYPVQKLLDEKLNLSDKFLNEGKTDIAQNILMELIGLHAMAEPKLANLYLDKSKKAGTIDEKLKLIINGLGFHVNHSSIISSKGYNMVFKKLLSAYNTLIDKYYAIGEVNRAYQLSLELKQYSSKWNIKYVALRTEALSQINGVEDKINFIIGTFSILEKEGCCIAESSAEEINTLWDILQNAELFCAKSKSYSDCVQCLKEYSSYVKHTCNKDKGRELTKEIDKELITIHKNQAYKFEQEEAYSNAITLYVELSSIVPDTRTKSWCKIRCAICKIKAGKEIEEDEIRKILSIIGFAKEKKDLAYRYSIFLIKEKSAKIASLFIAKYLPDESELMNICSNECVKEAEILLNNFNKILDRFNTGIATLSEAKKLITNLDHYDRELSPYLEGVHNKIIHLQSSIKSYILLKYFEDEKFNLALRFLKDSGKNWYEDDVYLQNVAIACLGIIETGSLNKSNYKVVIAYWLTAVYHDQLFVRSLEYTSWDDSYLFTLRNSLGGSNSKSFKSLPENVNFEESVEGTVISIAEVQQSLLNRFEIALNEKDDLFRDFYAEEKDAMDSLVRLNLDNPCIIAAPSLVNNTEICLRKIKKVLDYEYNNYGDEGILKVGVLYNINSDMYGKYKEASKHADACISSVKTMSIARIRSTFSGSLINSIQEFPKLYGTLTTELQNILSKLIKDKTPYKDILNVFSFICRVINEDTMSYIFGNYINHCVVEKLNDKSLDLSTGLNDLVIAYKAAKSCTQLKGNIGNVLEALVGKYITEANSSDLATINSVLRSTGTEFEPNVANTLSDQAILVAMAAGHVNCIDNIASISASTPVLRAKLTHIKDKAKEIALNMQLSEIIDKVNNKSISYSLALQKVYFLYKSHKENSRICDNLCTLIGICIREYFIKDDPGKSSIIPIFNELKFHKSATYRVSANALKKERDEILSTLPNDLKVLLTGSSSYLGQQLSESGLKLKYALQLYLDLA